MIKNTSGIEKTKFFKVGVKPVNPSNNENNMQ